MVFFNWSDDPQLAIQLEQLKIGKCKTLEDVVHWADSLSARSKLICTFNLDEYTHEIVYEIAEPPESDRQANLNAKNLNAKNLNAKNLNWSNTNQPIFLYLQCT